MTRSTFYSAILVLVVVGAGFVIYGRYVETRPCAEPIHYAIGTLDSRFGLSTSAVREAAKSASSIWSTLRGKQLFVYDPTAALTINLVYDEREATAKLRTQILAQQSILNTTRTTLASTRARYQELEAAYNQAVSVLDKRNKASQSDIDALTVRRDELVSLNVQLNADIARYNEAVKALNTVVTEFNKSAGVTFEAGKYVRDASGEQITIYQFIGNEELVRVLAHEFGHALGLDHTEDPASIMYAENESGNLTPTPADKAALSALCGA